MFGLQVSTHGHGFKPLTYVYENFPVRCPLQAPSTMAAEQTPRIADGGGAGEPTRNARGIPPREIRSTDARRRVKIRRTEVNSKRHITLRRGPSFVVAPVW